MTTAERSGHGLRNEGLSFHHPGAHLGHTSRHFLRRRHGGGTADLGMGLRDELVGLRLLSLEFGAHVLAHIHIGDVEGGGNGVASK